MSLSRLDTLLDHPALWRGNECAHSANALPSGFDALDRLLPGGGWPAGALTELLIEREGIGEMSLLTPALARLTQAGRRVVFVDPPYIPYAPALSAAGFNFVHLLLVRTRTAQDRLWSIEQALSSPGCGATLAWPNTLEDRATRRLQLAAERGRSSGFLFMPGHAGPVASPAALRLQLAPDTGRLAVRVLKRRGSLCTLPLSIDVGQNTSVARTP